MIVVGTHTEPPISSAQNTDEAQRLLAAQAVLHSRSKRARNVRIAAIVSLSILVGVAASLSNEAAAPVGVIGGVIVLALSLTAGHRQRATGDLAVAIQEKFDTLVFQIPWNPLCVRHLPTAHEVASAGDAYEGTRTRDWYPDTADTPRPLDIVICQQSNLGWGPSVHRRWALAVGIVIGTGLALSGLVWWWAGLDTYSGMNQLVLPALPVLWEAADEVRRHLVSAKEKNELQQAVLDVWGAGITTGASVDQCRDVQNEIVHIRLTNAQVPDWFDARFRGASEQTMRTAASHLVEEARRHTKA